MSSSSDGQVVDEALHPPTIQSRSRLFFASAFVSSHSAECIVWVASGGYEPIAVRIFGGLDVDACFLEFDSERAGGFEPLRSLRRTPPDDGGGRVVAGEPGLGAYRH